MSDSMRPRKRRWWRHQSAAVLGLGLLSTTLHGSGSLLMVGGLQPRFQLQPCGGVCFARQAFPWESLGETLFGGEKVEVPATTKEVIESLKETMEVVIQRGLRRVDIELPPGLRLGGVEGGLDPLSRPSGELPPERVARADRDLARYMGILLKPVDSRLCLLFRNGGLMKQAKKAFQAAGTGGRLLAFAGAKGKRSAFGGSDSGTDSLLRSIQDTSSDFLVIVAPRARQLPAVARLCSEVGDKVSVVLLNTRLRGKDWSGDDLRQRLSLEFNPVFNLQLFASADGSDALLYRALQADKSAPWVVARRRLVAEASGEGESFSAEVVSQRLQEPLLEDVMATLG